MSLTTNLVSYWKLDESSGNAADSAGTNTLTNNGTMTYGTGKINNGAQLTAGKYLSIADASQTGLDFSTALTFAGWIKFTSIPAANNPLIAKRVSTGNQRSYLFYVPNGTTLNFDISSTGSDGSSVSVSWTPSTATWYNLGVTMNGSTAKFYVNGSQQGTTQTQTLSSIFNSTAVFEFGHWNVDGSNIEGTMDEWGVWSRDLTASEMSQLYNSGAGLSYPFTVGTSLPFKTLLGVGI